MIHLWCFRSYHLLWLCQTRKSFLFSWQEYVVRFQMWPVCLFSALVSVWSKTVCCTDSCPEEKLLQEMHHTKTAAEEQTWKQYHEPLTSVWIFSLLFSIHFLWCWQREFFQPIKSFFSRWSFPFFSWCYCVIQGWQCEEKIDASHS